MALDDDDPVEIYKLERLLMFTSEIDEE